MKTGEGDSTNFGENSTDEERWPLAADPEWFKVTLKGDPDCRENADGLAAAPLPPRAQPVGTETRVSAVTWGYSLNTCWGLESLTLFPSNSSSTGLQCRGPVLTSKHCLQLGS